MQSPTIQLFAASTMSCAACVAAALKEEEPEQEEAEVEAATQDLRGLASSTATQNLQILESAAATQDLRAAPAPPKPPRMKPKAKPGPAQSYRDGGLGTTTTDTFALSVSTAGGLGGGTDTGDIPLDDTVFGSSAVMKSGSSTLAVTSATLAGASTQDLRPGDTSSKRNDLQASLRASQDASYLQDMLGGALDSGSDTSGEEHRAVGSGPVTDATWQVATGSSKPQVQRTADADEYSRFNATVLEDEALLEGGTVLAEALAQCGSMVNEFSASAGATLGGATLTGSMLPTKQGHFEYAQEAEAVARQQSGGGPLRDPPSNRMEPPSPARRPNARPAPPVGTGSQHLSRAGQSAMTPPGRGPRPVDRPFSGDKSQTWPAAPQEMLPSRAPMPTSHHRGGPQEHVLPPMQAQHRVHFSMDHDPAYQRPAGRPTTPDAERAMRVEKERLKTMNRAGALTIPFNDGPAHGPPAALMERMEEHQARQQQNRERRRLAASSPPGDSNSLSSVSRSPPPQQGKPRGGGSSQPVRAPPELPAAQPSMQASPVPPQLGGAGDAQRRAHSGSGIRSQGSVPTLHAPPSGHATSLAAANAPRGGRAKSDAGSSGGFGRTR
eukprot:gnl/TRDRNA2_/TRDRNA2_137207_c0_seq1.p1 gnl/TRDRNA2_/TRDRNA2_137207_c0~~gnl/TRDRNA2_/TRDRNA2_137207_c0_seq1.p1  ORF type:complete len:693 (+),score=91.31 gnl/TRDRNA2_/TRDRNA2_137207_c0_seq1:253-2079(+)